MPRRIEPPTAWRTEVYAAIQRYSQSGLLLRDAVALAVRESFERATLRRHEPVRGQRELALAEGER